MDFLFDIGNVIVGVDFIPSLTRLIPEDANNVQQRLDTVIERKDEFEAGRIPAETYFPWAAETLGFHGSQQSFLEAWRDIFTANAPMWRQIESLHAAGHRLILFSNIHSVHRDFLFERYAVFAHFAGGIYSYQTGHVKPEDEIYQLAIQEYQLKPETTAYIDDLPANIAGGQRAGFHCHQYDASQHQAFTSWLQDILQQGA